MSQGGVLEMVRVKASGRAGDKVAEGKREARVGVAAERGLTRSRGQEWKEGWVAWRAEKNVPKPQLTEIQPLGWYLCKRSREAERAGGGGVEEGEVGMNVVWMGKEERMGAAVVVVVAVWCTVAVGLAIGGCGGHLVVY